MRNLLTSHVKRSIYSFILNFARRSRFFAINWKRLYMRFFLNTVQNFLSFSSFLEFPSIWILNNYIYASITGSIKMLLAIIWNTVLFSLTSLPKLILNNTTRYIIRKSYLPPNTFNFKPFLVQGHQTCNFVQNPSLFR